MGEATFARAFLSSGDSLLTLSSFDSLCLFNDTVPKTQTTYSPRALVDTYSLEPQSSVEDDFDDALYHVSAISCILAITDDTHIRTSFRVHNFSPEPAQYLPSPPFFAPLITSLPGGQSPKLRRKAGQHNLRATFLRDGHDIGPRPSPDMMKPLPELPMLASSTMDVPGNGRSSGTRNFASKYFVYPYRGRSSESRKHS
ncbi:hypothetical protein NLJ89_g5853 [Agrocybe chaxingu]|uniref:Uncharacterized protein n=1 Tax=Agrocybe chaxingu TaxID=84603 RepID=A0A9W8K097_9AGAR|nr:hypothetical protein NLJ89_g5853 [Agrocybe chaxingu]